MFVGPNHTGTVLIRGDRQGADSQELPWFAVRVSSNHEKISARILHETDHETFLPLHKIRRRWSDRFKVIDAPLFPGYIFCRIDLEHRLPVLTSPGVVHIVSFGKAPVPVDESEIAALRTIVNSGLRAQPWPYLNLGETVRVEYGPLSGVEGIFLRFKRKNRLVASVSLLQRSVAVELDDGWVMPVPAKYSH